MKLSAGATVCLTLLLVLQGCQQQATDPVSNPVVSTPVAFTPTDALTREGLYISWIEHRIDDSAIGNIELTGSDGLVMGDLDGDGFEDIVSVHESDTTYDGKPIGHVRVAYGSADPDVWQVLTLADGPQAAAAEDVDLADVNGDGHLDVIVAAELAHLLYLQNPGHNPRTTPWPRTIPEVTRERGSYIRSFFADFDNDGQVEVVAPNKGAQNPALTTLTRSDISIYHPPGDPLQGQLWREQMLTRVRIPINSQPVDLDGDGDLDVVAGSRGEGRILWLENLGRFSFIEHPIDAAGKPADAALTGFNMDYADLNGDGRLDIVSTAWPSYLLYLMAPTDPALPWETSVIGNIGPDQLVSVKLADIDGDGDLDAFTGAYSRGPRDRDGADIDRDDALGRISWFANPGPDAAAQPWLRHDISRRARGMYDKWLARDLDQDGDLDFIGTRGNSEPYDGVIWLEQVRSSTPQQRFSPARDTDSRELPLP